MNMPLWPSKAPTNPPDRSQKVLERRVDALTQSYADLMQKYLTLHDKYNNLEYGARAVNASNAKTSQLMLIAQRELRERLDRMADVIGKIEARLEEQHKDMTRANTSIAKMSPLQRELAALFYKVEEMVEHIKRHTNRIDILVVRQGQSNGRIAKLEAAAVPTDMTFSRYCVYCPQQITGRTADEMRAAYDLHCMSEHPINVFKMIPWYSNGVYTIWCSQCPATCTGQSLADLNAAYKAHVAAKHPSQKTAQEQAVAARQAPPASLGQGQQAPWQLHHAPCGCTFPADGEWQATSRIWQHQCPARMTFKGAHTVGTHGSAPRYRVQVDDLGPRGSVRIDEHKETGSTRHAPGAVIPTDDLRISTDDLRPLRGNATGAADAGPKPADTD